METPGIPGPVDDSTVAAEPPDDNFEASEPTANRKTRGSQSQPEPAADTHARASRSSRNSRADTRRERSKGRERPQRRIPSQSELLFTLTQLTMLTATGVITAAQNNAMRANVLAILNELRQGTQTAGAGSGDTSKLREALRRNPDLLHALEPFVRDEVLFDLTDDDDGDDAKEDENDDPDYDDPDRGDDTTGPPGARSSFTPRRPK